MSRPLQEKLLDAGIIPEDAVKQMEHWQVVAPGSAEKIGEFDPKKIEKLREEFEPYPFPTLQETVLDVNKIMDNAREITLSHEGIYSVNCSAGVDVLKRYIFVIPKVELEYKTLSTLMRPGSRIVDNSLSSPFNGRVITEVSVLYRTVREGSSVPCYWFCATRSPGEDTIVRGR